MIRPAPLVALFFAGAVFAAGACKGAVMHTSSQEMQLQPDRAQVGMASVTAKVNLISDGGHWEVVVVLSLPPDTSLASDAVQVDLLGSDGRPLVLLEGPTGTLPAFGDPRGISANARFLFDATTAPPASLVVHYGGENLHFALKATP